MTKDARMKEPKPTVGLTQAQLDTKRVIRLYQQQHDMSLTISDVAKEIITFIENNPIPNSFNNIRGTIT